MLILGLDTSGRVASVALMQDGILLAEHSVYTTLTHSQVIMPMCQSLLESAGKTLRDVDRLAVACGPGSYTGIRIGVAATEAMAFALGIGCNGISTLESLAYNVRGFKGLVCAVMKARLDLLYCATFLSDLHGVSRYEAMPSDRIVPASELYQLLSSTDLDVTLVGDAAESFYSSHDFGSHVVLASPRDRLQSASSLCEVASLLDPQPPHSLRAAYLQPTKAEKDLLG